MNETNYWKIGLFVIVCALLGVGALVFLGARQFDRVYEDVYFYFDEPVDGLSIGSEVRLRGIPIGSVKDITLAPDLAHVGVSAQIDVKTLVRLGVREENVEPDPIEVRRKFIAVGLRAYLETNPLTGLSIVNLDMYPDQRGKWPTYPFETPTGTIATVPSTLKGIMGSLEGTLKELQKAIPPTTDSVLALLNRLEQTLVDIEPDKLATSLNETLVTLRQEVERLDVAKLSLQGQSVAEELRLGVKDVRDLVADVRNEEGSVQRLLATYNKLGEQLRDSLDTHKLDRLATTLTRAMDSIGSAGEDVSGLSRDLQNELSSVLEAIEALRRLAVQLERDPGSLLYGKSPTPLPIPREGS